MIKNYSEENVKTAITFFRGKGLNDYAIGGLFANIYPESKFNTKNLQNSANKRLGLSDDEYTAAVDNGTYTKFATDKAGYGLCQWTSSGRKTNLLNYARQSNVSIGSLIMQLEFLWLELTTSYKSVLRVLQNAKSVDEAARAVMLKYERPANKTEANQLVRVGYGEEFYKKYLGKSNEVETVANTVDKVIKIAEAEVGYLEKRSNSQLDDKTANAGKANYTKYGRDMHNIYPSVMDFPAAWCDAFVDWCFYMAYGIANAKGLIGGNFNDYTPSSANLYKNKKAWYNSPKVGDQIFFKNSKRINHTGLVYKIDDKYVYTIEGNTSGASGVIANGGGVCKKRYALTNSKIAGYGRPAYDTETEGTAEPTEAIVKYDAAQKFWKSYGKEYTVTATALNMRKGAGTNKDVITVLPKGTKVRCYGYYSVNGSTTWLLVVSESGYTGYCSKKYLK